MNIGDTKRFSCGTIDFDLTVYNAAPEGKPLTTNGTVLDGLAATISEVIDERVIPACRQLAITTSEDQVGSSQVNYGVSYDNEAFDVRIELTLQVAKAGIKDQLLSLLAHELTELHTLPALAVQLRQPPINTGFLDSLFGIMLNPHGPQLKTTGWQKLLDEIIGEHNPFEASRFAARGSNSATFVDFQKNNPRG